MFRSEHVDQLRTRVPGIKILVHPECPMEVVDKSDVQGSTGKIIREVEAAPPGTKWAIGTELHLVNRLKHEHPEQEIHFLSPGDLHVRDHVSHRPSPPLLEPGKPGGRYAGQRDPRR